MNFKSNYKPPVQNQSGIKIDTLIAAFFGVISFLKVWKYFKR